MDNLLGWEWWHVVWQPKLIPHSGETTITSQPIVENEVLLGQPTLIGKITKIPDSGETAVLSFRSCEFGNFLSGRHSDGQIKLSSDHGANCKDWTVTAHDNGKYSFQQGDRYLKSEPGHKVSYAYEIGEWEEWTLIVDSADKNKVAFRSHHGTYLSARNDGTVCCMDNLLGWEWWFVE